MQLTVDLLLAAAGILTVVRYARRGVIGAIAALVGWVIGFWVGLHFAPGLVGAVSSFGGLKAWQRNVIVLVVVVLIALVCSIIVISIGNLIRRAIRPLPVAGGIDSLLGAVFGVLAWAVTVWLLAGFATSTSFRPVTQLAESSRIVQALDSYAPLSPSRVFGAVDDAVAAAGLPKVFESGDESISSVSAPPASVPSDISAVDDSIVEVVADEPACNVVSSGSGWVVAAHRVVTNAHVVAGSSSVTVLDDGKSTQLRATVVSYDPETDLAVLAVPQLTADPIALNASTIAAGTATYAAGYPGGGAYTVTPARIRETISAVGKDIYDDKTVTRQVYSLRAAIRAGDSGGPLLDGAGRVVGVVFARSASDSDTGYALTMKQVQPKIATAAKLRAAVATGECASE